MLFVPSCMQVDILAQRLQRVVIVREVAEAVPVRGVVQRLDAIRVIRLVLFGLAW